MLAPRLRAAATPQAAHRHLKPRGLLVVLWTDRDLASSFVLELEELLEGAVPGQRPRRQPGARWPARKRAAAGADVPPRAERSVPALRRRRRRCLHTNAAGWCRYDAQRDPQEWIHRLQAGGFFRLIDFAAYPHTLALRSSALMDALSASGALHAALGSSRRRAFHAGLQQLLDRHCAPQQQALAQAQQQQGARQVALMGSGGDRSDIVQVSLVLAALAQGRPVQCVGPPAC